jgi:chromosome segregation ATPase
MVGGWLRRNARSRVAQEDIMDIKTLEKDELVDLTAMLSARLAKSVETEMALTIRVKGLERALDAASKNSVGIWEARCDNIYDQFLEQQGRAEDLEEDLKSAKEQAEERRRNFQEILEQRDHAMAERDKAKSELGNERQEREHAENQIKSAREKAAFEKTSYEQEVRGLQRELREARATVMNEISAMIPKAVEAEREACMDVARQAALTWGLPSEANVIMTIVNKIKERK